MLSDVTTLFDPVAVAPAADRRLTRRVADLWARAARGRFPSWSAVEAMGLGEDGDWIFVVDARRSVDFPYFTYVGARLARLSDVFLSGAGDVGASFLDRATADIHAAVASAAPHFRSETLTLCDGRRIMIRAITAPLAEDGTEISHVLGAVNGRFAPEGRPIAPSAG